MNPTPTNPVDTIANGAEKAATAVQKFANDKLDGATAAHDRAAVTIHHAVDHAENLAQRGIKAAREGTAHLREKAIHASDALTSYIRQEPVKSVLMAAAAGAALVGLLSLVSRARSTR